MHFTMLRESAGLRAQTRRDLACHSLSHVQLFATPWTSSPPGSSAMGFSRQESWSEEPLPFPGAFPDPGVECSSPTLGADSLPSELPGKYRADPWYLGSTSGPAWASCPALSSQNQIMLPVGTGQGQMWSLNMRAEVSRCMHMKPFTVWIEHGVDEQSVGYCLEASVCILAWKP